LVSLASLARWRYQRERAWWRRVQPDQWSAWPDGPGQGGGEQPLDLGDGQRDHPGIWRPGLVRSYWRGCLGVGAVAELAAVTAQMAGAATSPA
jgi:hypothetical protein